MQTDCKARGLESQARGGVAAPNFRSRAQPCKKAQPVKKAQPCKKAQPVKKLKLFKKLNLLKKLSRPLSYAVVAAQLNCGGCM